MSMTSKLMIKDPAYMLHNPYMKPSAEYDDRKVAPSMPAIGNLNLPSTETINMMSIPSLGHGNNPDVDNMMQIHRRKMLRRAANRKSGIPPLIMITHIVFIHGIL